MDHEKLNTALYEKMFAEQEKYREWLLTQPPEEILNHAYEYTIREDIVLALEYHNLSREQASVLLESPSPLADVFKDFEKIETNHMDNVWDCIESRADDILKSQQELRDTPLYLQTARYATEHGEQAMFRVSHNANIACRDAIEKAIADNYKGNHLDVEATSRQVGEKFTPERLHYILAATVQGKDWDGRYSHENKAWAKTVFVADGTTGWGGNRNTEFTLNNTHSILVDAFVTHVRKELAKEQEQPQKKPSVLEKLQKPTEPSKPSVKKAKEQSL